LAGFVQHDLEVIFLAGFLAIGLQQVDQPVAQLIAIALGDRFDKNGGKLRRQAGAAIHGPEGAAGEHKTQEERGQHRPASPSRAQRLRGGGARSSACDAKGGGGHTTMFTIRLGTTITFLGVLPSRARTTPSSFNAAASTSLLSAFLAM